MLASLVIGVFAVANPAESGETEVEFRDKEWGTHVDSVLKDGDYIDFVEVDNSRASNAYRIPGDDMTIGTVELDQLHYIFNEDKRLTQVYMEADMEHRSDMRFILRHRFGEPDEIREMVRIKMHEWDLGDVQISMTEYEEQETFSVSFNSRWDQSEAYRINTNIDDF